jgi:hypothetical protein
MYTSAWNANLRGQSKNYGKVTQTPTVTDVLEWFSNGTQARLGSARGRTEPDQLDATLNAAVNGRGHWSASLIA